MKIRSTPRPAKVSRPIRSAPKRPAKPRPAASFEPLAAKPSAAASALAPLRAPELRFRIEQPPNTNLFLQSNAVSTQVIVSSDPRIRAIATFPAGNSGVALFADPKRSENKGLTLTAGGELQALKVPAGNQGVRFTLTASKPDFVIDQTVLDSLRSVREVTEGTGAPLALLPEQRALVEPPRVDGSKVTLARTNLDGGRYVLTLEFPTGTAVAVKDGALHVQGPGRGPLQLQVEATVPYAPPTPLPFDELVDARALAQIEQLDPNDPRTAQLTRAFESLKFLAYAETPGVPYSEKLLAGAWRFETYFGRDTMLSALMLKDVLSPKGLELALASVLDRVSSGGQVAHEEDVGSFAERRQLELHDPDKARAQAPLFDYKMIDSDLLLPLLMDTYARKAGPGALDALLSKPAPQGGTRADAARRNFDFIANEAARYDGSATTLLKIHDDQMVGDWRDSNVGLAGGKYPGSVNVDLVSNALQAMERLKLRDVDPTVQARWASSSQHYAVHLSPDELRQRLKAFLELPSNAGQRERLLGEQVGAGTLRDFLDGRTPAALARGFDFMALSLDENGGPIPVVSSDASLRVFLGDPTPQQLAALLPMLELPYPIGLMTPAGLLTANPALTGGRTLTAPGADGKPKTLPLTQWLDRAGYHGTVVWVWQQSMMELGLIHQIERLKGDRANAELVQRMRRIVDALHSAAQNAGALANAELYTFNDAGQAAALSQAMGSDTEANAVQLWSTVGPAVQLAYQRLQRDSVY